MTYNVFGGTLNLAQFNCEQLGDSQLPVPLPNNTVNSIIWYW